MLYTYITLDDPLGTYTWAYDINDAGQFIGEYSIISSGGSQSGGFLYGGGTYITLNDPSASGPTGVGPFGINNAGQIVGDYANGTGIFGFLYSGGTYTALADPLGALTWAYGINNAGQIVGAFNDTSGSYHGFLFGGGTYITLDDPLGTNTIAQGINDSGQIVGSYWTGVSGQFNGFLYSGGTYITINDPSGAEGTDANGINNEGEIVGDYWDSSGVEHGFLYSGGTYITLDDPLGTSSGINGINNAGQIVGSYTDANGNAHGFEAMLALFTTGADTVDFNNLTTQQQDAITGGADIYHGLGGSDVVTLPDEANYNESVGNGHTLGWTDTAASTFYTGSQPGDTYTINGGNGSYYIVEGKGPEFITINGNGNSNITAGSGADTIAINGDGTSTIIAGSGNEVVSILGSGTLDITGTFVGSANIGDTSTLELGGPASGGSITFISGGTRETLRIDGTATPTNVISGFVSGDTIDLKGVPFDPSGYFLHGTNNLLEIVENGHTYTLQLDPAANFAGGFALSADSTGGGTDITVTSGSELPPLQGLTIPGEQIEAMYVAYFGRAGDPAGTDYWVGNLDTGQTIGDVGMNFSKQLESENLYAFLASPNTDNDAARVAFIDSIYENLFNRAPDTPGLNYWDNELQTDQQTLSGNALSAAIGGFILEVVNGAQNSSAGQDITSIQNKVTVASYFTDQLAINNINYANNLPATVDAQAHAVVAATNSTAASVTAEEAIINSDIASDLSSQNVAAVSIVGITTVQTSHTI